MAAKNKFLNAMKMPSIDDMFSSEADRQRESGDLVTEVPLSELHPFVGHPFEVRDDEDMQKLVDSIRENGVLTNLTVRRRAEGGYEIISGHRRFHAAQRAGLTAVKVQVRDIDDDQAIISMVDSNIQREHISPMEKARAYRMKYDALKRQGCRTDLTSPQVAAKLRTDDRVAADAGVSGDTVRRFIRLNSLVPDLQKKVDDGSLKFNPAVELSYLSPTEQNDFLDYIESQSCSPSLSQAQKLKAASKDGALDHGKLLEIMDTKKPSVPPRDPTRILFGIERLSLLQGIMRPNEEMSFSYDWLLAEDDLTTKDFISPSSYNWHPEHDDSRAVYRDRYQFGDKIGKTMYLRGIAPEMKNGLFSMLSELPFDHVITMHVDAMDQAEAVQEIEKKLAYMHKEEYDAIAKARERNMPASIAVSYNLKSKMHHTEQMMDDITTKNQKIFKVCILIHTYGDSNAQLDERVRRICSTVQQQTCRFDSILYEQRNAMNSMLPLGKKWLGLERTLETVSTAIYVPFTTQELFQPGGLYEGINARSKNLILCNRKLLPAPAGMVLGMTGYGKSFSVMQMVTNIMLRWPDDDIVLIDPEQEYTHLVTAMGGVVIDISASSPSHINPMDITEDYGDDEDPIRLKSQFLQNFCQLILHSSELSPQERTFIDVAAGLTYQRYMANPKREEMPTLHDFYRNLALQGEEVKPLLTALKLYVSGSMDLFAHQTNVNVQNHCICFNTVKLGKSMQSIGMLTVLDQVWNRITRNRVLGRRTWVFTDEFQQLLGNKDCTDFYFQLSSRARKWGAILTSITQHVRSVLDNEDARRMLSDCGYIKLLNQSPDDANDLARLLHISNEEKRYIENAEVGSGLLIVSKTVVPFNNDFPKDTELFRLMDTSPNRKS